jgi:SAM-dependent methyltransferase
MNKVTQMDPEFDRYAEDYEAALNKGIAVSGESKDFFAQARVRWTASRLTRVGRAPTSVLDFGCGTGSAAPFLRQAFPAARLVGTDISAKSLETARRLQSATGASFEVYPEYQPTSQFDLAYCNGVFHHIPLDQRTAAARYMYEALKPGGCFALWENNPWNPGTRLVMSRIPFDRTAITLNPPTARRLLRSVGFEIIRTDALFIFPHILKGLRFLEPAVCRLPLGAQYQVLARRP